jgi:hypothetical protein
MTSTYLSSTPFTQQPYIKQFSKTEKDVKKMNEDLKTDFISLLVAYSDTSSYKEKTSGEKNPTGLTDFLFYNQVMTVINIVKQFKEKNKGSSTYKKVEVFNKVLLEKATEMNYDEISKLNQEQKEIFENLSHTIFLLIGDEVIHLGLSKKELAELKELTCFDSIIDVSVRGGRKHYKLKVNKKTRRSGSRGSRGSKKGGKYKTHKKYGGAPNDIEVYEEREEEERATLATRIRSFLTSLFSYGDIFAIIAGMFILYFTFITVDRQIRAINIPITVDPQMGSELVVYDSNLPPLPQPLRFSADTMSIIAAMTGVDQGALIMGITERITGEFLAYSSLGIEEITRATTDYIQRETARINQQIRESVRPSVVNDETNNFIERVGMALVNALSLYRSPETIIRHAQAQTITSITRITQDTQEETQRLITRFTRDIQRRSTDAISQTTLTLERALSSYSVGFWLTITGLATRTSRILYYLTSRAQRQLTTTRGGRRKNATKRKSRKYKRT